MTGAGGRRAGSSADGGGAGGEAGLLGALAAAQEQGERLSVGELYANPIVLLNAGHATTTSLIGNGTLSLLRHPDQMWRLREELALPGNAPGELPRSDDTNAR